MPYVEAITGFYQKIQYKKTGMGCSESGYESDRAPMVLVEAPIEADKASSIDSCWFIRAPGEVMG